MPLNINSLSDDTIARGITPPDVGNFGTAFTGTQDYLQKQALQNLFAGGLPKDPNDPTGRTIDWSKAMQMALQVQGAPGLPGALALRQADIQQQALQSLQSGGGQLFDIPQQAPKPRVPSIQGSGLRSAEPQQTSSADLTDERRLRPDQPGNLGDVTGVSVDGQPTEAPAARSFAPVASTDSRYPPEFGPAPDRFTQVAQAQQTRPQPPPPPTESPIAPGQPGYFTEENAARHEAIANRANYIAQNFDVGGLKAEGLLQQGKQAAERAKQIREHISKATEPTQAMKDAAASGLATPTQYEEEKARREKAGGLYATRYEGITKAGSEAAAELPQLQVAKTLMDNPKFMSGVGEEVNLTYKRLLAQLGGDPNAAVPQEAFRKLISNSLLENMRTMTGTGQLRVATIRIMQQAAANPENTVAANRLLVEMNARLQQRALETMDLAQNYRGGQLDAGFDRRVQQYDKQHPLFTEAETKDPRLIAPPLFRTPQEAMYSGQARGTPFRTPSGEIRYIP